MLLALCWSNGCGGGVVPAEYADWVRRSWAAPAATQLGPGDEFEIRVYQEPDLSGEYTVGDSGSIVFPLIGNVVVGGRDCSEVEADIGARLRDGLVKEPAVSCRVKLVKSARFSVVGDVSKPGTFPYVDGVTVIEAIAGAQGVSELGSHDLVIVTRVVDGQMIDIRVPLREVMNGRAGNLRLWPNDTVFVPSNQLLP